MEHSLRCPILLTLLLTGCSEGRLVFSPPAPPACAITAPSADSAIVPGPMEACLIVSDADTPAGDLTVTWMLDTAEDAVSGPPPDEAGLSCATLSVAEGDTTLEGIVTDPEDRTGRCTIDLRIQTGEPTPPQISLSPTSATTLDDLEAFLMVEPTDVEGRPLDVTWSWSVDGVHQPEHSTPILSADQTSRGEVWTVTAQADSGEATASVEIANSAPSAPVLELSPDAPTETLDTLHCGVVTPSEDADDDPISYRVLWTRDGVVWTGDVETSMEPGDTIPASALDEGQHWQCEVTPEDGTTDGPTASVETTVLERVFVGVSAGAWHACAWDDQGRVTCWGDDRHGQVSTTPTDAFAVVDASTWHSCGVTLTGELRCWGIDDGSDWDSGQVRDVPSTGSWVAVGAAGSNNCAIDTDGRLTCWGNTDDGRSNPPSGAGFLEVVGGVSWLCATDNSGVVCWGEYANGVGAEPEDALDSLSAGSHACGLRVSDDEPVCWGFNDEGQTDAPFSALQRVTAGQKHSCGIDEDGALVCWGSDFVGESSPPEGDFLDVSAASHADSSVDYFTCALDTDHELHCFGADTYGQQSNRPGAH